MTETPSVELLIGTGNRGKVREIKRAFYDLPLKLQVIDAFPKILEPEESGTSYAENAIIKARSYAKQSGLWTLADDSGLEVASLGGSPGLTSARFGGEALSDVERTCILLSKLSAVGKEERAARFICVVAIAKPTGEVINVATGKCEGSIANAPTGEGGFGYDPVFVPAGYDLTFAEMPSALKDTISHRAKALAATKQFLARFFLGAPLPHVKNHSK